MENMTVSESSILLLRDTQLLLAMSGDEDGIARSCRSLKQVPVRIIAWAYRTHLEAMEVTH